jgi:hypothetical protein
LTAFVELFLERTLSFPVPKMWRRRSCGAVVAFGSPNTAAHSPKLRAARSGAAILAVGRIRLGAGVSSPPQGRAKTKSAEAGPSLQIFAGRLGA